MKKLGNPGQVRKNRVKPLASEKYRIFILKLVTIKRKKWAYFPLFDA